MLSPECRPAPGVFPLPLCVALVVMIAVASSAAADVTMKHKTVSSGLAGFGNGTGVQSLVIAGDKSRSDDEFTYTGRFKTLAGGGKPRLSSVITRVDKELIWTLHPDKKQYAEMTFAEMRELMSRGVSGAEAQAENAEDAQKARDAEMEFSVDVKRTGKKETVNGFPAEQVILTLTGTSKDKKSGGQGSFTMTVDQWLSDKVPGAAEAQAYYRQMAEKLGLDPMVQQMGRAAIGMYGNAIREMAEKMKDLRGYAVRSTMTIQGGPQLSAEQQADLEKRKAEAGKADAEAKQQKEAEEDAAGRGETAGSLAKGDVGGAFGGFLGKKLGKAAKKKVEPETTPAAGGSGAGPAFTSTTELLSASTAPAVGVSFDVPGDYKKISRKKE